MKNKEPNSHWAGLDAARAESGILDTAAPIGITAKQYADKYSVPYATAEGQLKRMVERGALTVTRVRTGFPARVINCYTPAVKKKS